MKNIKVSIVTVTYNAEKVLDETIKSIVSQDYKNKELIFIDGDSTDKTIDIISENMEFISTFICEKDKGIYDAMNKGLNIATGDFLIFMNAADTFVSNDVITNVVKSIKDLNAIYYGNALYFTNSSDVFIKRSIIFNKFKIAQTNICHQTIFYPIIFYKKAAFNIKYKLLADWEYNMIAFKRKIPFVYLHINIANYDHNGVSITHQDFEFEKDVKQLIFKNLGLLTILYLGIMKFKKILFNKFIWK